MIDLIPLVSGDRIEIIKALGRMKTMGWVETDIDAPGYAKFSYREKPDKEK